MTWDGWFELDDGLGNRVEFINAARTETYLKGANRPWLYETPYLKNTALPWVLSNGQANYTTPLVDSAPWTDPDRAESYDFWGVYPMKITGLEDSTREATAIESILDGGLPGALRHSTRTVVFECLLYAADDLAADYGLSWLKRALLGPACAGNADCLGLNLRYLAAEPVVNLNDSSAADTPEECLYPLLRTLHRFAVTRGPVVVDKKYMTDESCIWAVSFTGVAGTPFEFSQPRIIVDQFGGDGVVDPYPVGQDAGAFDQTGVSYSDVVCPTPFYEPLYDPSCPPPEVPPGPPAVSVGCGPTIPTTWLRRFFTIPRAYVPKFDQAVPQIVITAEDGDLNDMRIRIFPRPLPLPIDNCDPLADFVISHVPEGYSLVIDGVRETVYATDGANRRRADSLVFNTQGEPFNWPALSCGYTHTVTVDSRPAAPQVHPVTFSLVGRSA